MSSQLCIRTCSRIDPQRKACWNTINMLNYLTVILSQPINLLGWPKFNVPSGAKSEGMLTATLLTDKLASKSVSKLASRVPWAWTDTLNAGRITKMLYQSSARGGRYSTSHSHPSKISGGIGMETIGISGESTLPYPHAHVNLQEEEIQYEKVPRHLNRR